MSKRTKLLLIILIALLLLAFGVWIFLQPILKERQTQQPPALPTNVVPYTPPGSGGGATAPTTPTTPQTPPPTTEENQTLILENRARATVERVGSGVNSDGFLGYQDVLTEMTASGRAALLAEQKEMQRLHPATGPTYGISTRVVSSDLQDGSIGDTKLVVRVEAIQRIDAGDPSKPVQVKEKQVLVTFVKQGDDSYLIDKLEWSDLVL